MTASTDTPAFADETSPSPAEPKLSPERIATAIVQATLSGAANELHYGTTAMVTALLTRALSLLPGTLPAGTEAPSPCSAEEIEARFACSIAEYATMFVNHRQIELAAALADHALAVIGDSQVNSITLASAFSNIGATFWELERGNEAIAPLERALAIVDALKPDITKRQPDPREPDILALTNLVVQNLAVSYMAIDRYDDAAPLVERLRPYHSAEQMVMAVAYYDQHLEAIAESLQATAVNLDNLPDGKIPRRLLN